MRHSIPQKSITKLVMTVATIFASVLQELCGAFIYAKNQLCDRNKNEKGMNRALGFPKFSGTQRVSNEDLMF